MSEQLLVEANMVVDRSEIKGGWQLQQPHDDQQMGYSRTTWRRTVENEGKLLEKSWRKSKHIAGNR